MILFYTGAKSPQAQQINANLSLGGFVSSMPVPNGRLNNIFSSISKSDIQNKKKVEVRMIALQNTTGASITGVTIHTVTAGKSVILKTAAVAPATNSLNQLAFETIYDGNTLPFQATLAVHEANAPISVGTMANNATIGIWIAREIDETKFPLLNGSTLTQEQLVTAMKEEVKKFDEEINLVINWN